MILLWGMPREDPIAHVHDALLRQGHRPKFLDQGAAIEASAEMSVGSDLAASVRTAEGAVDLHGVTAAYLRPYDPRDLPAVRRAALGSESGIAPCWWRTSWRPGPSSPKR